MKWIGISGSWRKINAQVEADIRSTVREIITRGDGIVTGGALGVDYIATEEVVTLNPTATLIKVYLPTTLHVYSAHYRKRAREGVITKAQAESLISQLERLLKTNKEALIGKKNTAVNQETYYQRNMEVINASHELIAFHVNDSEGTQHAIDQARKKGIPVKIFNYIIN